MSVMSLKEANLKTQTGVAYVCRGKKDVSCGHPWFIQYVNYRPSKCHCGKRFPKFIWENKKWINLEEIKEGKK